MHYMVVYSRIVQLEPVQARICVEQFPRRNASVSRKVVEVTEMPKFCELTREPQTASSSFERQRESSGARE